MIVNTSTNTISQRNLLTLGGRKLQKYNTLKYRVICAILDYIAFHNGIRLPGDYEGQQVFKEKDIIDTLISCKVIHEQGEWYADFNSILSEMCFMGLISHNNGYIAMTSYTIEAYSKQIFHQILASLLAAEDSRLLSKRTLIVSFFAFLAAITSIVITLYK